MGAMAVFKGLKERRRSRRTRRSRESASAIFTQLAERRRKAGRKGRRSRELVRKLPIAAKQRRRSRRTRRSREVVKFPKLFAAKQRRRSRRSRRSRESVKFVAKQRRRSRRSRRTRRSREVVKFAAKQRRRRSYRRSREVVKFAAKQRRRSRKSRRSSRARRTMRRSRRSRETVSLVKFGRARQGGLGRLARQGRRPYSAYMPRVRERGGFFGLRQTNGTRKFIDLTKKAAVASIGTVAGRVVSTWISNGLSRYAPSVSGAWVKPATSAGATALIWWAAGTKYAPGVVSRNRELLALGAALHFVEDILGLVLPMIPGLGRTGVLGEAIFGSLGGGAACAHGQALGGCQYGCQWPAGTSPCPSPYQAPALPVDANGQPIAGLGGCQYGCQWPAGTTPCPTPYQAPILPPGVPGAPAPSTNQPGPVSGLAGDMAVRKAGDAARDPFVSNMLAQRAGHAQSLMDSVGIGR